MTITQRTSYRPDIRWFRMLRLKFSVPLSVLAKRKARLVEEWVRQYSQTFGHSAFFSESRVRFLFERLTGSFIECFRNSDYKRYFEELQQTARTFVELGVPFEEVILSIHLFQRACLIVLRNKPEEEGRADTVQGVFDELGRMGTAIFALSYFRDAKSFWEQSSHEIREENESFRNRMSSMEKDMMTDAQRRLSSMELAVTGINRKLRENAFQFRQIQKLQLRLETAADLQSFLKSTEPFLRNLLPDYGEIMIAVLDEHRQKYRVFAKPNGAPKDSEAVELCAEIMADEILAEHASKMHADRPLPIVRCGNKDRPSLIFRPSRLRIAKEYLVLPLMRYREHLGFIWIASAKDGVITRESVKFFRRLARTISAALMGLTYFNRHHRRSELAREIESIEGDNDEFDQTLDHSIDHYLGAFLDVTGVERASLMMWEARSRSLKTFAAKGCRAYPFSGIRLAWGEGLAGAALREAKTICISRMPSKRRGSLANIFSRGIKRDTFAEIKSLVCVPLIEDRQPIGVVNLSTLNYYKAFETREIQAIGRIADKMARILSTKAPVRTALLARRT